jgi:hypothetical protein
MAGRIIGTLAGIIMTMYISCLMMFFFMHQSIRENINMLNYETAEIAATSGMFSISAYEGLLRSASKFGNYGVSLKLEVQLKPGVYDTFYNKEEILGKRLKVGDRLSIFLKDSEPSLFVRLLNVPMLGQNAFYPGNTGINSLRTAVISKNADGN